MNGTPAPLSRSYGLLFFRAVSRFRACRHYVSQQRIHPPPLSCLPICSSLFLPPQAAWSEAFDSLKAARSRVRACQQDVRNKFEEAKPLQEALKRIQEGNSAARARGRSLEATSEGELNAMVRGGWSRAEWVCVGG